MWNFHRPGAGYCHVFTRSAFLLDVGETEADVVGLGVFLRAVRYVRDAVGRGWNIQMQIRRATWLQQQIRSSEKSFTANLGVGFESVLNVECSSTENGFMERRCAGRSARNDQLIGTFGSGCTRRRVVDGFRQQKSRYVLHRWARSEADGAVAL